MTVLVSPGVSVQVTDEHYYVPSHTYAEWQALGFQVRIGQKATGFTTDGAAWFSSDQVREIKND
jgi:hypothetical protein